MTTAPTPIKLLFPTYKLLTIVDKSPKTFSSPIKVLAPIILFNANKLLFPICFHAQYKNLDK